MLKIFELDRGGPLYPTCKAHQILFNRGRFVIESTENPCRVDFELSDLGVINSGLLPDPLSVSEKNESR